MRKLLLLTAATAFSTVAMAQWTADTGHGIRIWQPDYTNYGYEVRTSPTGVTYGMFHGVWGEQTSDSTVQAHYPMLVQVVDKDGNLVIEDDGVQLSDEPNRSWTAVNQNFAIDDEGNAVVAVSDQRTGDGIDSYTIYKVSPTGELLWDEPVLLPGYGGGLCAAMSIACTGDGYVFAYETFGTTTSGASASWIVVSKVSKDGQLAWNKNYFDADQQSLTYPYLVNTGDNQVMMVYAFGANQTLKATLFDFDGEPVWDEDVTIYKGGFTGIPLWVQMAVEPGPDGGALVAWQDAGNGATYENRMAYVMKDDGMLGFASGEGGTVIDNESDWSRMYPDFYYDEGDGDIYAVYRKMSQAYQSYVGLYMQKLSTEGELYWGAYGKALVPMSEDYQFQNWAVRDAGDGRVAVFWQQLAGATASTGNVETMMAVLDSDGDTVMAPRNVLPDDEATKSSLTVSSLIDGEYYIISWEEKVDITDITGPNSDGGSVSGDAVQVAKVSLNGQTTRLDGLHTSAGKPVRREFFSLDGKRLDAPQRGVVVVRDTYADGTVSTGKVNVTE